MNTLLAATTRLGLFADNQPVSLSFLTLWLLMASLWVSGGGWLW